MSEYVFDSDRPTAVRRALRGLSDSTAGVSQFMSAGDVDLMYMNLVEAVMWVRALNDLFEGDTGYVESHETYPGKIVAALEWTRDKSLHQLAVFHDAQPRLDHGLVLGPVFPDGRHAVWLPSDGVRLPDPLPRGGDERKRKIYDEALAGRPICSTLAEVQNFLFMQPWTVEVGD